MLHPRPHDRLVAQAGLQHRVGDGRAHVVVGEGRSSTISKSVQCRGRGDATLWPCRLAISRGSRSELRQLSRAAAEPRRPPVPDLLIGLRPPFAPSGHDRPNRPSRAVPRRSRPPPLARFPQAEQPQRLRSSSSSRASGLELLRPRRGTSRSPHHSRPRPRLITGRLMPWPRLVRPAPAAASHPRPVRCVERRAQPPG